MTTPSVTIEHEGFIGARLRVERHRLQLNQTEFAQLGGVRKLAQLRYEHNERMPDAQYLLALAQAGVDIQYVLTGERSLNWGENPRLPQLTAQVFALQTLMQREGLSPIALAEYLNVALSELEAVLTARALLPETWVAALQACYGEFLDLPSQCHYSADEQALLRQYRRLRPHQRRGLQQFLNALLEP